MVLLMVKQEIYFLSCGNCFGEGASLLQNDWAPVKKSQFLKVKAWLSPLTF